MMGPNTASGHGSVSYTTECQINFTLRVIKPVLNALRAQRSRPPVFGRKSDIVQVKADAERADIDIVQEKARKLVWSSGCTSYALDTRSRRNTVMYPDFQWRYWLRSIFIPWDDFEFSRSGPYSDSLALKLFGIGKWLVTLAGVAVIASILYGSFPASTKP